MPMLLRFFTVRVPVGIEERGGILAGFRQLAALLESPLACAAYYAEWLLLHTVDQDRLD